MGNLSDNNEMKPREHFVRSPIHIEPKGWGREVWIANNNKYWARFSKLKKRALFLSFS